MTDLNTPPRAEPRRRVWPWIASAVVLVVLVMAIALPNASRKDQSGSPSVTAPASAPAAAGTTPAGRTPATDETNPPAATGRPN